MALNSIFFENDYLAKIKDLTLKEIIRLIILDVMKNENVKFSDITFDSGGFSNVLLVGNKVIKLGSRLTKKFPNNPYIIAPLLRRELKNDEETCFVEVTERVNTTSKVSNEELYQLFKNLRNLGLVWIDVKDDNVGRLKSDNIIYWHENLEPSEDALELESKRGVSILKQGDLVILDAPCSGEGMIRKYPEILDTYSTANILSIAEIQKNLLDDAYKLLNEGGQLVYSTCTFAFEEDEDQVNIFLNKYKDMKLVGDCKKLSFLDGCEGQFMALLKKDGTLVNKKYKSKKTVNNKTVASFIKDNIDIDEYYLYSHDNNYYLSLIPMPDLDRGIVRAGIYLGEVKKDRFEPAYNLYRSNKLKFKYKYDLNDDEYNKFIKGESLQVNLSNHYYQVTYKGFPIAYGKCSNNELKNKYPKGLRRVV